MKTSRLVLTGAALLMALGLNVAAWGQEKKEEKAAAWPKRPGFSLRFGSYFSRVNTQIRVDGANGLGTEFDVSNVLGIPPSATVIRARGEFRLARWFGVEAEYYRIGRSRTATLDRDLTVGDVVFTIDETVSTRYITSYVDLALKFYLIHKERYELGLWLGANVHFMTLSLEAQPSSLGVVSRKVWLPIPAAGVHFSYSLLPRLYLYGKAGLFYYKLSETEKFNSARFDISLDYYVWKALGIGATFAYDRSSVLTDRARFMGLVRNRASGLQIYALLGF
jgi:hypothetical protein